MVHKNHDELEALGTSYCPNCAILKEKMKQLEIWEANISKREEELDREIAYIQTGNCEKSIRI